MPASTTNRLARTGVELDRQRDQLKQQDGAEQDGANDHDHLADGQAHGHHDQSQVRTDTGHRHQRGTGPQRKIVRGVLDRMSRFVRRDADRRYRIAGIHLLGQRQFLGQGVVVVAQEPVRRDNPHVVNAGLVQQDLRGLAPVIPRIERTFE